MGKTVNGVIFSLEKRHIVKKYSNDKSRVKISKSILLENTMDQSA